VKPPPAGGEEEVYVLAIPKGKRFVVVREFSTTVLTHWRAPMTDGLPCTVPRGTILVVASNSPSSRVAFICVPEDYDTFVSERVPEDIRRDPKFAGISLVIEKKEIGGTLSET